MKEAEDFDLNGALERVDQDKELFFELFEMFFEDYEAQAAAIRESIEQSSGKGLEESAHSIKSALGNIGAMKAFEMAYTLEKIGRSESLDGASEKFDELIKLIETYRLKVEQFKATS